MKKIKLALILTVSFLAVASMVYAKEGGKNRS